MAYKKYINNYQSVIWTYIFSLPKKNNKKLFNEHSPQIVYEKEIEKLLYLNQSYQTWIA